MLTFCRSSMTAPALPSHPGPSAGSRPVRPFLKWAGGKRQLLPRIREFYPATFAAYREPFLGSGAVFFDLVNQGRLVGRRTVLTDTNGDLVGCYTQVRDEPEAVIRCLRRLAARYTRDPQGHYYRVRRKVQPRETDHFERTRHRERSIHGRPGGHAGLPEPNGLQWPVSLEFQGPVQCAAREILESQDL